MNAHKSNIIKEGDVYRYFDKEGNELHDGDKIKWDSGKNEVLYLTDKGRLGTDATNPIWIENGRAVPCQYGIYPLEYSDMKKIVKVQ